MTVRILAAEDSPTQAAVLVGHLEAAGFEVALAGDGAAALALLEGGRFDVVVSDVVMPEVDGYELCRAVKRLAPEVPVILLTSLDQPMEVVNALLSGADGFLRKPYQPEELLQRVRSALRTAGAPPAQDTGEAVELVLEGRRFVVDAGRQQVVELLVSTFEGLVAVNEQLRAREAELAAANERVAARLAEADLERQRLRSVLAALPHPMSVTDRAGTIVDANGPLASLLGVPIDELLGACSTEVFRFVDHSGKVLETDRRVLQRSLDTGQGHTLGTAFDLFLVRRDGSRVPVVTRAAAICDRWGEVVGAVGVVEDIGALSAHDPVTGLPGYEVLVDRLEASLLTAGDGGVTGLLTVKVDRFDRLRQALATSDSDRVVASVAERLGRVLDNDRVLQRSKGASAAHLGNGELAVILPGVHDEADAIVVAELLVADLPHRVQVGGVEVGVTVSVAVGTGSQVADVPALVPAVAAAARSASAEGGGRVTTSDPVLHAEVVRRLRRESELRAAIHEGQLVVHYQPQIDLVSKRPVGVEALVRWEHPRLGLLGAGDVIPLAIDADLIVPLGWSVLEQACRQAAAWRRGALAHGEDLVVSVNLAAEQLLDGHVDTRIAEVLDASGLDPAALVLEITERSVVSQPEATRRQLAGIQELGVRIAIDDFGTGYSSLLQLRQLPVDVLKIDRTFVAGMRDEAADVAIVAGTVSLARALGLETVAEGVETAGQVADLRELGCELGQGYRWARPMPAEETSAWWERYHRGLAR